MFNLKISSKGFVQKIIYLLRAVILIIYWVTQKLPQICSVILRICIGKVAWFEVYICSLYCICSIYLLLGRKYRLRTVTRIRIRIWNRIRKLYEKSIVSEFFVNIQIWNSSKTDFVFQYLFLSRINMMFILFVMCIWSVRFRVLC